MLLYCIIGALLLLVLLLSGCLIKKSKDVKQLRLDRSSFEDAYLLAKDKAEAYEHIVKSEESYCKNNRLHCQYQITKKQASGFKSYAALMNSVRNHMAIKMSHDIITTLGDPTICRSDETSSTYEYVVIFKQV